MSRKNIAQTLGLFIIFQSLLPCIPLTSLKSTGNSIEYKDPIPSGETTLREPIYLNYSLSYEYENNEGNNQESFQLNLKIMGTDGLLENGTIEYWIDKNITDTYMLEKIYGYFEGDIVNYFANHQKNELLKTYFSYRKESNTPYITDSEIKGTYSIFWLNTTKKTSRDFEPWDTFKFYSVTQPYNLFINKYPPHIVEGTWSDDLSELRKNKRILEPYFLKQENNADASVQLFYDKVHTVLLRATISIGELYLEGDMKLELILENTNLEFEFLLDNPYWQEFKQKLTIYLLATGICIIVVVILWKRKAQNKSSQEKKANSLIDEAEAQKNEFKHDNVLDKI